MNTNTQPRYVIRSVVQALKIVETFPAGEPLELRHVVARSGVPKSTVFRMIQTLVHCGVLRKVGRNLYGRGTRGF
jgi:DNA-binding IclR family transcriptional regulator